MSRRPLTACFAWSLLPVAAIVMPAHAVTYMSASEARKLMFPDADRFSSIPEASLRQWQEKLAKILDADVRIRRLKLWEVRKGEQLIGYFATDAAIGRDDYFDYAVSLDADAVIRQVEILNYKEAHGQEVHDHTPWRKQFTGKNADSALELDTDIKNISGATLSCSHLTDNIRTLTRLLKTGQGGAFKTS
ncbi:MAG: FMN-binding protein [Pedobacter sp.]|nr:FMN-binding protein [Pedobacter sp.]